MHRELLQYHMDRGKDIPRDITLYNIIIIDPHLFLIVQDIDNKNFTKIWQEYCAGKNLNKAVRTWMSSMSMPITLYNMYK